MIDEEILELRRKLDESISKEKSYDETYKLISIKQKQK